MSCSRCSRSPTWASRGAAQLVIDMAPTGHALELLRTPERMLGWCRLLMKSLTPHRHLPLAQEIAVEVASIAQRVRGLAKLLQDSGEVWMVLLPEALPDRESARLYDALVELDLKPTRVFLNRVLLGETRCPRCRRARAAQATVLRRWQARARRVRIVCRPRVRGGGSGGGAIAALHDAAAAVCGGVTVARAKERPGRVFYLYGITAGRAGAVKIAQIGVDGSAAVEAVACGADEEAGDLVAWYSAVLGDDFGANLAARMESLEWLAETSVRHQRVVAAVAAKTAIVPARFGTVFLSVSNMQAHVAAHAEATRKSLAKISDAEEWGVKVYRRKRAASAPTASGSGTDYLKAKAKLKIAETAPEIIAFANDLSKVAADAAAGGKLSSSQRDVEWQAAFLVKRKQKAKWDAVLRRYAQAWGEEREIECTGPWPPYSFV